MRWLVASDAEQQRRVRVLTHVHREGAHEAITHRAHVEACAAGAEGGHGHRGASRVAHCGEEGGVQPAADGGLPRPVPVPQAAHPRRVGRRRGDHHRHQRGCECAALHERRAERRERQLERGEAGFEARARGVPDGALRARVGVRVRVRVRVKGEGEGEGAATDGALTAWVGGWG